MNPLDDDEYQFVPIERRPPSITESLAVALVLAVVTISAVLVSCSAVFGADLTPALKRVRERQQSEPSVSSHNDSTHNPQRQPQWVLMRYCTQRGCVYRWERR